MIELMIKKGAEVAYHDPYVAEFTVGNDFVLRQPVSLENKPLLENSLAAYDCCVIITPHRAIDYQWVVEHSRLVIDTSNATRSVTNHREKVIRLGAPNKLD